MRIRKSPVESSSSKTRRILKIINPPLGKSERRVMLDQMETASNMFYMNAVTIGNHAFIEFTGLMREYIDICRIAHKRGVDFSTANVHTGNRLKIEPFQLRYLREKLDCIFGNEILSAREDTGEEN